MTIADLDTLIKIIEDRDEVIVGLKKRLKEAEEVIRFYGDEESYDWNSFKDMKIVVEEDNGDKAREYLTKHSAKEES